MDSLFEQIGGEEVVEKVVAAMYRNVLGDSQLAGFFAGVNFSVQERKFRMFLHVVTGGPHRYSGLELRAAHSRLVQEGLSEVHMERFLSHFGKALHGAGIRPALADEIMDGVRRFSDDTLGH